jgi:tetratricopeptide (TPR) repeat protein
MMEPKAFRSELERVDQLSRAGQVEAALGLVCQLSLKEPASSELLLRRAMLEQLSRQEHSLEEIERCLREACLRSPGLINARLELGHFLYAIRNQPLEALDCFAQARTDIWALLREAMIGEVRCHADLHNREAQLEVLANAESLFPRDLDISLLRADSEE